MAGGAPIGNQNAKKARRWQQALERVLARKYGDVDSGLEHLAEQFIEATIGMTQATEKRGPDVGGFKELADRMDGKATQALEHSGPDGAPLPATINVTLTKSDA